MRCCERLRLSGLARAITPRQAAQNGVLLDLAECCLAAGQPRGTDMEEWQFFDAPVQPTPIQTPLAKSGMPARWPPSSACAAGYDSGSNHPT
jgi:hypothetical protein